VASEAALFRHIVPAWWWRMMRWLNVGTERRLAEAKAVLDEFVYREIANRKSESLDAASGRRGGGSDLLSLYMAWPRDPGVTERQRDQFLRDSAVGYMFAAKDLIVAALTWFFYILCTHPHVEAKILQEIKSLRPGRFLPPRRGPRDAAAVPAGAVRGERGGWRRRAAGRHEGAQGHQGHLLHLRHGQDRGDMGQRLP